MLFMRADPRLGVLVVLLPDCYVILVSPEPTVLQRDGVLISYTSLNWANVL